jgi:hypothetical protein
MRIVRCRCLILVGQLPSRGSGGILNELLLVSFSILLGVVQRKENQHVRYKTLYFLGTDTPKATPEQIVRLHWLDQLPRLDEYQTSLLPFGLGRSYGDSCLNEGGTLLDTTALNRFIAFDRVNGILRCEAGVSLAQILELVVPQGWFLPGVAWHQICHVGGCDCQ